MPSQKSKAGFLSLAPEIRLRIYEFVLVAEDIVVPSCRPAIGPVAPSILRTCKRIHSEASPIPYSKNEFLFNELDDIYNWFKQIGRANIKHLASIRIHVEPEYDTEEVPFLPKSRETPSWYEVLNRLAREATGLRHVRIFWNAELGLDGAGKDVHFVHELAKIQGLQSMVIGGYYAMHWPRYLAEKMSVLVQERGPVQYDLRSLRKYQRGTENLVP